MGGVKDSFKLYFCFSPAQT